MDPREAKLAALVVELEHAKAARAETTKAMKENESALEESISRLAEEINSGQAPLFPPPETKARKGACSKCGKKVDTTVSLSGAGIEPTPPVCLACMKEVTDAVKEMRR